MLYSISHSEKIDFKQALNPKQLQHSIKYNISGSNWYTNEPVVQQTCTAVICQTPASMLTPDSVETGQLCNIW